MISHPARCRQTAADALPFALAHDGKQYTLQFTKTENYKCTRFDKKGKTPNMHAL